MLLQATPIQWRTLHKWNDTGNQIQSGDSGKYIINQLVGIADKKIVLSKLDPNTSYDFLDGQTPAQVLQQLKDQRKSYNDLVTPF